MLIDSSDEVFKGVVYTLSGRLEVHVDLELGGGQRFEDRFDGRPTRWVHC